MLLWALMWVWVPLVDRAQLSWYRGGNSSIPLVLHPHFLLRLKKSIIYSHHRLQSPQST